MEKERKTIDDLKATIVTMRAMLNLFLKEKGHIIIDSDDLSKKY